jgi:hypothetical protein
MESTHDQRPADLAGQWYPSSARACDAFLEGVRRASVALPERRIGAIAPHAGWVYSGAVAYEALRSVAETNAAELVVVFGGHLGPRDAPRLSIEGSWATPYGPAPIARDLAEEVAMALSADPETPDEYYEDNAIEVLMPMVEKLWPGAHVLTIGVPPTKDAPRIGAEVATLARKRFDRIALVGSTDLTHYGPNYSFSPKGRGMRGLEWVKTENDPAIIAKMEALEPADVLWIAERQRNACCPGAAAACLTAARRLGATKGVTTEYTTSFDVKRSAEEPSSFVGYVGIVLGG